MLDFIIPLMYLLYFLMAKHISRMETLIQAFDCLMECLVVDDITQFDSYFILDDFIDFDHIYHYLLNLVDRSVHVLEIEIVRFNHL
jgi:hypothetical protein